MTRKYKAVFSLDVDGRWLGRVEVSKKAGANTYGRTLEQTKERMREALTALLDCEPDEFELIDDVQLPAAVRKRVEAWRTAERHAQEANARAQASTKAAAQALVRSGLSLRDAGAVLGVSRQRVDQIIKAG